MTTTLTSKSNPIISKTVLCRDGKNKDFFFVEGGNLFEEVLKSSLVPVDILCVKEKESAVRASLKESSAVAARVHLVDSQVMKFISDLESPPGIVALVKRPMMSLLEELPAASLVLLIHRVQLPQNVGALMRTAEATGVKHVWATKETADPFSPKTIRGSAGSLFRLTVRAGLNFMESVNQLKEQGFQVLAADQTGKLRYDQINWKQKSALVVGNEGAGFTREEIHSVTNTVTIPMAGEIESLNVSIAGSVCLYEAFRQRGYPVEP